MTLGPKLFCCNKIAVTRRPMNFSEIGGQILKALGDIYKMAVSKRDLKRSLNKKRKKNFFSAAGAFVRATKSGA